MKPYIIGLTGGIASGKSTLMRDFEGKETFDVKCISADEVAKKILEVGESAYNEVIAAFGKNILLENGEIDRVALRNCIILDVKKRELLESITHPKIRSALYEKAMSAQSENVIIEIPLLGSHNIQQYDFLDKVIAIEVLPEVQLKRLMKRDGMSEASAKKLIAAQPSNEDRRSIADEVIEG